MKEHDGPVGQQSTAVARQPVRPSRLQRLHRAARRRRPDARAARAYGAGPPRRGADTAAALQDIRQRLDDLDDASAAGIAASLDGLAASLGTLDSKLTARLERLDERLDDQYDRVRTLESTLKEQPVSLEEAVAKGGRGVRRRHHGAHRVPRGRRAHAGRGARRDHRVGPAASSPGCLLEEIASPWPRRAAPGRRYGRAVHSHSMVPGGLLVMSSTTRLTSRTSLVIRVEIRASTS